MLRRILDNMNDIYYGRVSHPWAIEIEEWKIDPNQHLADYVQAEQKLEMGSSS